MGNAAFVLAFLLVDPSCASLTRIGRWMHGAVFGVLLVIIRTFDPAHPEGALFAALLAALTVPLIDYLVVRGWLRWRWRRG